MASLRPAAGHWFLLPWFVGFFGLTMGPALASLVLSFTTYDLIEPPRWVGMANYVRIATADSKLLESVRITLLYVVLSVPFKLGFALAVAMVLNRGIAGLSIYRALFYLPSLLGASVAVAVLWRQVFSGDGLLHQALLVVGIHSPSFVSDPDYAIYTLVALSVWQFGSPMFYTLYLYQEAFGYFRMGYAAALAWLLVLAIAAVTALAFLTARRWVHYEA
jgi:multiple sugar transport system permease protein